MTFILDCHSGESTLLTVAKGFNCSKEKLAKALLSLDLESIYEQHGATIDVPSEEFLYNHVVHELGNHRELKEVYWFHCTRTVASNTFSDGIDHLGDSLEKVWQIVLSNAPDEQARKNLSEMRQDGIDDSLYRLRTEDSIHWGPFAILVREVAFHAGSLSQHDYLEMPELVEDICNEYSRKFNVSLFDHYSKCLVAKLVKFKSTKRTDEGCINAALGYAYTHVRKLKPNGLAVTGFDGSGVKIEAGYILDIETTD